MKYRQARASGQPRVATARRCLRSVSAVACCSSNGRGCGRTIAGRRSAATSATQLWPAGVITTSAAQMSGHGSGVLRPPRRPNVFQVISAIDATVASTAVRKGTARTSKGLSRNRNDTDDATAVPSLR